MEGESKSDELLVTLDETVKITSNDVGDLQGLYSSHQNDEEFPPGTTEFQNDIALINKCFDRARDRFNQVTNSNASSLRPEDSPMKNLNDHLVGKMYEDYSERMNDARESKDEFAIQTAFNTVMETIREFVQRQIAFCSYNRPLTMIFMLGKTVDKDENLNFWKDAFQRALTTFMDANSFGKAKGQHLVTPVEKALMKDYLTNDLKMQFDNLPFYSRISARLQKLVSRGILMSVGAEKRAKEWIQDMPEDFCTVEDENCMEVETFKNLLLKSMNVKDAERLFSDLKGKKMFRLLGDFKRKIDVKDPSFVMKRLIAAILIQMTVGHMKTAMIVSKAASNSSVEVSTGSLAASDSSEGVSATREGGEAKADYAEVSEETKADDAETMPLAVFKQVLNNLVRLVAAYTGEKEGNIQKVILNSAFVKKDNGVSSMSPYSPTFETWYNTWSAKLNKEVKDGKRPATENVLLYDLYKAIQNSKESEVVKDAANAVYFVDDDGKAVLKTFGEMLANNLVDFNKEQKRLVEKLIANVNTQTTQIRTSFERETEKKAKFTQIESIRKEQFHHLRKSKRLESELKNLDPQGTIVEQVDTANNFNGLFGGFALEALVNREIAAL